MRGLNYKTRFIDLAGELNTEMPLFWVRKVAEALNGKGKAVRGANVLVLGVAYKRDIDDMRESPALDVMGLLHEKGARVSYADPYVPEVHGREWPGRFDIRAVEIPRGSLAQYDCVVIVTEHKVFDFEAIAAEADLVVDTRNAIKKPYPHVFRLGAPRPEAQGLNIAVT
jgi:UDP-N-acetyl-D-glucosamine dehydrogenase